MSKARLNAAWAALSEHWEGLRKRRIEDFFTLDPRRFERYSISLNDVLLDYSKTKIDDDGVELLVELARAAGVEERRDAMYAGEKINVTEDRAVLHVALRDLSEKPVMVDGVNMKPEILDVLARMRDFAEGVRGGSIRSSTDQAFTDVVNIGIGGSDLGPAMAVRALMPYRDGPRVHFVSNIDGAHISQVLAGLDPERTLFLIASKSFTTVETMTNAETAWGWLSQAVGEDKAGQHFAAISTALDKVKRFDIPAARVFGYWDWVGGRYSVWTSIGLPVMIAIGADRFADFLEGGHEVDEHFRSEPIERNMPMMLGLLGVWHANICGYGSRAVLPYDQNLKRLPAYIQQLDMESNGKSVAMSGQPLARATGPVIWGEVGTNGQHAFFQLLHQGAENIPCEFLVAAEGHEPELNHHHELLVANCIAQSEALMRGRSLAEALKVLLRRGISREDAVKLAPHRTFSGDRPSTTLLYRKLDPRMLGRIIALYEHRVFVEGAVWGVNSFDQWGVELGKELATELYPMVRDRQPVSEDKDASTAGLLAWQMLLTEAGA